MDITFIFHWRHSTCLNRKFTCSEQVLMSNPETGKKMIMMINQSIGWRVGTVSVKQDFLWLIIALHQSVTGCTALPCTNKTLHGWEEGSHSDCCAQSDLQHYTKTLAFIWPTAHRSPKHHSGSQEVSVFLAALWLWHWQYQHFVLHSQGTQQMGTVMFLLSKQVRRLLSHRTVCPCFV